METKIRPQKNERKPEGPRINHNIRVPRVLLIDETGRKLGQFMTRDAVTLAEDRGLDLVEVSPNASPPVCKIMDYGKLKYERKKAEKERRKNSVDNTPREIRMRPGTDTHDYEVKLKKARELIGKGSRVKITVRFKGREMRNKNIGIEMLNKVVQDLSDISVPEGRPAGMGRSYFVMLMPQSK